MSSANWFHPNTNLLLIFLFCSRFCFIFFDDTSNRYLTWYRYPVPFLYLVPYLVPGTQYCGSWYNTKSSTQVRGNVSAVYHIWYTATSHGMSSRHTLNISNSYQLAENLWNTFERLRANWISVELRNLLVTRHDPSTFPKLVPYTY